MGEIIWIVNLCFMVLVVLLTHAGGFKLFDWVFVITMWVLIESLMIYISDGKYIYPEIWEF